ncbi:IPT/TIG domain-containing protein, partial [Motilibacter deserti]|nr:hypothetical protein [Motilibacter deserti]
MRHLYGGRSVRSVAAAAATASVVAAGIVAAPAARAAAAPGSARAVAAKVDLGLGVLGIPLPLVALGLGQVSAPPNSSSSAATLNSGALGGGLAPLNLVAANAASTSAEVTASIAKASSSLAGATVNVPGLANLLEVSALSSSVTCPANPALPITSEVTLPTTVKVAGRTVDVSAGGTVVVPLLVGSVTLGLRSTGVTGQTGTARALLLQVDVNVIGVARTAGTVALGDVSCTRPGLPAPVSSGLSSTAGPVAGGGTVTLRGHDLSGTTAVTFGGVPAGDVTVVDDGTVTVTVPPHAPGTVDVVATSPGGTTAPLSYRYAAPPVAAGVSPAHGPVGGGPVTIPGSALQGARVTFDGVPATDVTTAPDGSSLTAAAPPHAAGPVAVTVTTAGGTAGPLAYVYDAPPVPAPVLTAMAPAVGQASGGTSVTVTGTGLAGASGVTVGGVPATQVAVVDPMHLTFVTPAGQAGPAPVVVTTPAGASNPLTFTYWAPVVSAVAPAAGPEAGGTPVTVSGAGLGLATGVSIGGTPATGVTVVDGTTVTATAPAGTGTADVVVELPGDDAVLPGAYTYLPAHTPTSPTDPTPTDPTPTDP